MSAESMATMMQGLIPLGHERQGIQHANPFLSFLQRGEQVSKFQLLPGLVFIQAAFKENQDCAEVCIIFPYTYINGSWFGKYLIVDQHAEPTHIPQTKLLDKLNTPDRFFFRLQIKLQMLRELDDLRALPKDPAKIAMFLNLLDPSKPIFSTIKYDPFKL
jgi:hypothetical protein